MAKRLILVLALMATGCASTTPDGPSAIPARSTMTELPRRPAPQTLGTSVQGRSIEMFTYGQGDRPVLVIGAIHGNESTTAIVAQRFGEYLHLNPQLTLDVPVAIIPIANPDGRSALSRTNANKVDCNRNFPAKNFRTKPTKSKMYYGGSESASEPETLALIKAIDMLRPRLIISIHSIGDGKQCNNYDGPAKLVAERMQKFNSYPAVPTIGYPTPGSLGNWAGVDRQIPMITLELPRALSGEIAWENNRDALAAAIEAVR
jgi:predicted deacylase